MNQNISSETGKRAAAFKAVDSHIGNGYKVGIGSGSTVLYAVQRIQQNYSDISCIPITFELKQLIRENGLRLTDLEESPVLDVTIDGADEVEVKTKTLIIGGGCGAQTQAKIIANASKRLVIIGDISKESQELGQKWNKGIPIEVIPMAYKTVGKQIEKLFKGTAVLRMAEAKAGPLVTDNNNLIIDWNFDNNYIKQYKWEDINTKIKLIPGVVETGLLVPLDLPLNVYLGREDGTVLSI